MCVAAIGAVVGIASSVVSFMGAQADYEARAAQWEENKVQALAQGREEQKSIQMRMVQEGDAQSQKEQQARIEGAEIAAEAETSAASAGVSGISLGNILAGINRKVDMKLSADRTNYRNTANQLTMELKGTNATIKNRINSVAKPVKPNPLGYVLQGVGGALRGYSEATA